MAAPHPSASDGHVKGRVSQEWRQAARQRIAPSNRQMQRRPIRPPLHALALFLHRLGFVSCVAGQIGLGRVSSDFFVDLPGQIIRIGVTRGHVAGLLLQLLQSRAQFQGRRGRALPIQTLHHAMTEAPIELIRRRQKLLNCSRACCSSNRACAAAAQRFWPSQSVRNEPLRGRGVEAELSLRRVGLRLGLFGHLLDFADVRLDALELFHHGVFRGCDTLGLEVHIEQGVDCVGDHEMQPR
eukprot:scaffold1708_cov117-Isochrysis_galbana.AAC.3